MRRRREEKFSNATKNENKRRDNKNEKIGQILNDTKNRKFQT